MRDLDPIPVSGLDNPVEPRLPERPQDIVAPPYPKQPSPPKRPRDGDVEGTPKLKAGVISPNSREATDDDRNKGLESPLRGHVPSREAGRTMGAGFARLNRMSGADFEKAENIASAIQKGFRDARLRDARDAALANDPDFLRSLGFTGQSEDDF